MHYITLHIALGLLQSNTCTVKTENCAVVLLCVLMDDTPTIDVMWIFSVRFFYLCVFLCTKNSGVQVFYCAVNHCPHGPHD